MKMKPGIAKRQSGASIIEFAFVAFIFFLILWGMFEFGRAFYVRNTTQHLTRCIAREAVIRQPSPNSALAAKQACLMPASGGFYFWPFYQIVPADMTDMFVVRYYLRSGEWKSESEVDSSYANQAALCAYEDPKCVLQVQVYVAQGSVTDMLNLVATWVGYSGGTNEPFAATTMPAESMGYLP